MPPHADRLYLPVLEIQYFIRFIFQRDFKERIQQQKSTQNRLREQRQQIARAKKYHSDYHVQQRARLMRARTKEERVGSEGRS